MITYEFNFICDGEMVLKPSKPPHDCFGHECLDVWAKASDVRKAWLQLRAIGWRTLRWRGKERHICPECWQQFIERRK